MEEKKSYKGKKTTSLPSIDYSKVPPQALDLEESVLGALMLEKDAYARVNELLSPASFYKDIHGKIYTAITNLAVQNAPVDMYTVTEELRKMGVLDEIGGPYYIAELTSKVSSAAHIEYHARIIAQKYMARELIRVAASIESKAFDEKTDVDDLMEEAEGMLFEVSQRNVKKEVVQINPIIQEALRRIQEASKQADGYSGLQSGFHRLDKITSGWQDSDLIVIAARPAMGKTALVISMAKNMAVDFRYPVAIFSLEMSNVQLVNRLIVNVCEIPGNKIKNGQLEHHEWKQLDHKINALYDAPIYIDDTPSLSVLELRTKARRLVREHGVKVIFIDYLQLMNASGMNFYSRQEEVSIISRSLKGLAKELDIPIIALSQLNRSVESRTAADGKVPQLSDLRESGAIEQDADIVCFIHRPEIYKITEDPVTHKDMRGIAQIIVAKHRNGAIGTVDLRFKSEFARFMNEDDETNPYEIISSKAVNGSNSQNDQVPTPTDYVLPSSGDDLTY